MAAILTLVPGWYLLRWFFHAQPSGLLFLVWIIGNLIFGIWLMKNFKAMRVFVPVVAGLCWFAPEIFGGISYFAVALIYWFLIRD